MKKILTFTVLLLAITACTPDYQSVVPSPTEPLEISKNINVDSLENYYVATAGTCNEQIFVYSKKDNKMRYAAYNITPEEKENSRVASGIAITILSILSFILLLIIIVSLIKDVY